MGALLHVNEEKINPYAHFLSNQKETVRMKIVCLIITGKM